jgi:hypothetical protein
MQQRLPRRFHIITTKTVSRASGFELTNGEALFRRPDVMLMPPPGRRGFRDYPELPMFVAQEEGTLALGP